MTTVITVNTNGRDITITPTRLFFEKGQGTQKIRWNPTPNNVEIKAIHFDGGSGPISEPQPIPHTNQWGADNNTDVVGTWKYTITLAVDGKDLSPLDPEIENGPPGDETGGNGE